jgi:hypothetical protein
VTGQPQPLAGADRWAGLYHGGGVAAFLIAALLVGEAVVYSAFPRPGSALEHFALFADDPLGGLLTLDLLGLIAYLLFVPTGLALYVALHRFGEGTMAVALALFLLGVADFLATNTLFPVLELSERYAAATADAGRAAVLAAGEAMFALFNENAFLLSYVIVSAAWALMGAVMLRSPLFGRVAGPVGILAGLAGIAAVILEHLSAALVPVAIPVYFAAIAFLLWWVILVGWHLVNQARQTTNPT